jgi:TolA-binding protein
MVNARSRWLATISVVALSTSTVAPAQQAVDQAIETQAASQQASAEVQRRINQLDDQTREMLNEYRQTMSQVTDLEAYNQQLERLVATQNVELADFERQFQEIETTKRQILPLIIRMLDVLEEFIAIDMPFLPDERSLRIAELKKLMERPDVLTSEKYRRVTEAYQIELDYGHTIEAYEGEIEVDGETRTVAFLRYGRLGLYYMTLDGLTTGYWDTGQDAWVELDDEFRSSLDRALRIARKQLPPDLTRLPVPAPENRI